MIALPHILIIEDNEDDYEATERSFRLAHFVNPIAWCRTGQARRKHLYPETRRFQIAEAIRTMNDHWFGIALLPQTNEQKGKLL
jgi:hypothetical protein